MERTRRPNRPKDITYRTYELWGRTGCPEGKDKEFHHQAEWELRDKARLDPAREADNS